jgi:signal transduction histidine kinase
LEQQQQRLYAVLNTMPLGMAITQGAWPNLALNRQGAALFDVQPGSTGSGSIVAGSIVSASDLAGRSALHRDGQPLDVEQWPIRRALLAGEQIIDEEVELHLPDRQPISLLISAAPIEDSSGRRIGAVSTFSDHTAAKRAHRDLEERRRAAEESSQRKSRFLAAVSHDIRTPANAISLLAELIQRTASTPEQIAEIPEIADDLKRSAITLVDLVSDVLDLTRFDSIGVELHESEFDLCEMIEEECRGLMTVAREKSLSFDIKLPEAPIRVRLDRVKLSRILGNLVNNAIKFTDRGGVRIRIERETQPSGTSHGGVRISVTDSGQGIAPENHARIFDEFFQLRVHGADSSRGSGLGLAICRRLIHAMGGQILLESTPGLGSTFAIQLPASAVMSDVSG